MPRRRSAARIPSLQLPTLGWSAVVGPAPPRGNTTPSVRWASSAADPYTLGEPLEWAGGQPRMRRSRSEHRVGGGIDFANIPGHQPIRAIGENQPQLIGEKAFP